MSQYKVKVRWSNGKKEFENVDLNLSERPTLFKAQLYTLTGVPIERQRLMCSGSMIKDDVWPEKLNITEATTFMLMGSADKLPEAPVEKPKFVEDLSETELAAAMDLPAGLTNLGNTCYMSATIQCLKVVPEFCVALKKFDANLSILSSLTNQPDNESVTAALRDLYKSMDETSAVVEPVILLRMMHLAIPRFAQRGEGNVFQQQDANECWTELTRILQQYLKPLNESSKYSNFIDEYFSGVLEGELKCDESPEEPVTKSNENFLQLSCFISQDVRYLQAGLISRMKETITKFSPSLNRDASYTKVSRISRLPAYLTIQMVRFHYKGNVQTNAKLLRDVKFSMILDVYDLCTNELQEKLAPMRLKYKNADDLSATSKSKIIEADQPAGSSTSKEDNTPPAGSTTAEGKQSGVDGAPKSQSVGDQSSGEEKQTSASVTTYSRFLANDPEEMKKYTFEDDPGSNNSGFYELRAVLTHKGRSSASGHYVAWIKKEDQWYKCDDDYVEPIDSEEILKLSGGGDWHCAYVLLYGPRYLDEGHGDTKSNKV
uniref:Ubiquitin carboxyl-terminal hydrolase n=1 Tax=Aceria tosichella TaxID=561515 RepID=A0A6G1S5L4_9ACAR